MAATEKCRSDITKCARRSSSLLRSLLSLLRRQVDTKTEHKHFMHRVKGGGVWFGCGKRLQDSGMLLAARAVSLAASSGLGLVIFFLNITSQTLVFFLSETKNNVA